MYEPRYYREGLNQERFRFFSSIYLESDLLVGVSHASYEPGMASFCREVQKELHQTILAHAGERGDFLQSLEPLQMEGTLHTGLQSLYEAGQQAGTGPMAGVAGLFAREVGEALVREFAPAELMVENGGDLWVMNRAPLLISIHAGTSPLSDRLGLVLTPGTRGICTSSGTLGHSFSRGKADGLTVVAEDAVLADAWATSLANRIREHGDVAGVLELSQEIPEILSCVAIIGDQLGVQGEFEIKPIT